MRWLALLVALAAYTGAFAQSNCATVLNNYRDSISDYGIVVLRHDTNRIDTASIGFAASNQRVDLDNRFCIGSCTKMYTAALVLKLHELQLLHIEDSIGKYLFTTEHVDPKITIKQLLNHTSGLADFADGNYVNVPLRKPYNDYTDEVLLKRVDKVLFPAGERHSYSNTNYLLLRQIIEVAADRPYESVFNELIVKPLGLEKTVPYYSMLLPDLAHPMIDGQDLQSIPKLGLNSVSRGIGNVTTTAYELDVFVRALLLENKVLKPETVALMTDWVQQDGPYAGLGLLGRQYGTELWYGHPGRQVSYISYALVNPRTKTSLIVLNNNANGPYIDQIVEKLAAGQ